MVILVDTNVIIDFMIKREPFYNSSKMVIQKCASREVDGYIAFHTLPNIWYILRKLISEEERRRFMKDLCSFVCVASACHEEVVKAIDMEAFKDFEDCLQDRCAENINADYIITRNIEDFLEAETKTITPDDFCTMYK